jgi:diacylglycerol O-acyltransferase / wax synthase
MKHLSGLDAAFLYLETPETPMHVGSLHFYDLPVGYEGDFYENVKKHVAGRIHLAPLFYRKLSLMPLELADPIWVEDDDVEIDYHVRRVTLPRPGSMAQLEDCVGRLHSTLLDRSRPLWEFYLIEGFHTGQMGFYAKVHHAAIDGAAGIAVANALLDITPQPREVEPPVARRRLKERPLGVAESLREALSNTVAQYARLVSYLPVAVKTITTLVIPQKDAEGKRYYSWWKNLSLGPLTKINVSITNQRSIATASIPLAEVKQIAKRFGATVNDLVLALCSGALRRYLAYGGLPKRPLIAAVPVSLRESGNAELNNQSGMMFCNLATNINDPLERLQSIHDSTSAAKETFDRVKALAPTDFPSFGAQWFLSSLASLYGRSKLADNLPPIANVIISNIPGPQFPLYLAGGKMATYYPLSIVLHGIALNITVESYNGSLDFGLTACRRAIPDVGKIAKYLIESHEKLKTLVDRLDKKQIAKQKPSARVTVATCEEGKRGKPQSHKDTKSEISQLVRNY